MPPLSLLLHKDCEDNDSMVTFYVHLGNMKNMEIPCITAPFFISQTLLQSVISPVVVISI